MLNYADISDRCARHVTTSLTYARALAQQDRPSSVARLDSCCASSERNEIKSAFTHWKDAMTMHAAFPDLQSPPRTPLPHPPLIQLVNTNNRVRSQAFRICACICCMHCMLRTSHMLSAEKQRNKNPKKKEEKSD